MNDLLHDHGLKNTPLRQAVLKIMSQGHRPRTVAEIATELKRLKCSYNRATLFRCLKTLVENKLLQTVDLGEGFLRYEAHCHEHHHHHHIICSGCKKIEVVPVCIPESVMAGLRRKGYRDISHRIDFAGVCGDCV